MRVLVGIGILESGKSIMGFPFCLHLDFRKNVGARTRHAISGVQVDTDTPDSAVQLAVRNAREVGER